MKTRKRLHFWFAVCLAGTLVAGGALYWQSRALPHLRCVRDGVLYRSGQPRNVGLAFMRLLGIRTVINLRGAEQGAAPEILAERREAKAMGATLHCLSVGTTAAELEDTVRDFLRIVADPGAQPVLVHCARGKERSGLCAAVFRMEYDGWSNQQALFEAYRLGLVPGTYRVIENFIWDYEPQSRIGAVEHDRLAVNGYRIGRSEEDRDPGDLLGQGVTPQR